MYMTVKEISLLLNQPIFDLILNDQRMTYMAEHRANFEAKELRRKGA